MICGVPSNSATWPHLLHFLLSLIFVVLLVGGLPYSLLVQFFGGLLKDLDNFREIFILKMSTV